MKITKFWKKIISSMITITTGVLTSIITDKYTAILIIVLVGIIGIWFVGNDELNKEEKEKIISRFIDLKNKYGSECNGLDVPNYYGYIEKYFSEKEVDFLYKNDKLNKLEYEDYKIKSASF